MNEKFTWPKTLALHLLPAAAAFAAALLLAPLLIRLHIPPTFAITLAFAFVLIPIELGLLLRAAHKATGRYSLKSLPSILSYREPIRKYWFLVPALFVVAIAITVTWSPIGKAIEGLLHGIYPDWLLPRSEDMAEVTRPVLIATLAITLLIDGILNPIVEELYFRGYLLSRIPVTAAWRMISLGALLFAVQHYWQPQNWGLIFLIYLILIYFVVRARSFKLAIVLHVLANSLGILLTLISVLTSK
jgi:uncharacterized protein